MTEAENQDSFIRRIPVSQRGVRATIGILVGLAMAVAAITSSSDDSKRQTSQPKKEKLVEPKQSGHAPNIMPRILNEVQIASR